MIHLPPKSSSILCQMCRPDTYVSRAGFPKGVELKEGMTFLTMREGYETPVTTKRVHGEDSAIDFNHPLAGETLSFDVELLDVRDATPEELEDDGCTDHGCGCGH